MSTVSAAAVANEFLDLAEKEQESVDQMKLEKLLFYAQAWWLAIYDDILFPEDIQAWEWGPVVGAIYYQTSGLGRKAVRRKLTHLVSEAHLVSEGGKISPRNTLEAREVRPSLGDNEQKQKDHIAKIWQTHKSFTGIQLSNATHAEGEPWTIVKDQYRGDLSTKPLIPVDIIKAVFKNKMALAQGRG